MNLNTAKTWKSQCRKNESKFLAGPHYSCVGNPKFSPQEMQHVMQSFEGVQPMGTRAAAAHLSALPGHKAISAATLRRHARRQKMNPYVSPLKPQLTTEQRRERLQFAINNEHTEFATWAFNDQFTVPFPMRSARAPYWSTSRRKVQPTPTVKFPESLHVHASLTRLKTVPLVFFEGNMNSQTFSHVNEEVIPNLIEAFEGHEFFYQHDRGPWFTSAETRCVTLSFVCSFRLLVIISRKKHRRPFMLSPQKSSPRALLTSTLPRTPYVLCWYVVGCLLSLLSMRRWQSFFGVSRLSGRARSR